MANRSYLPTSHRLLSGFSPLTSPRGSTLSSSANRGNSPPPEFSYDVVYPRDQSSRTGSAVSSREAGLGSYSSSRTPSSPGNSALSMAYSSVQDFPYGLSGVQMPTYNFGSELYNYVSNGFPRKSRMCTFCNKVFTRSTTRRYHERRCPLLRASNSLAKNEENNQSSTLSALKEQQHSQQHSQQQQQRQKESPGGNGSSGRTSSTHHNSALPRTLSSSITNTTTAQSGGSVPQASPPLPSLHPAYPTSFPKSAAALVSSPNRSSAYNYPHPYSSHFYNSLSVAALASLDQNSNNSNKHHHHQHHHQQQQQQQQQESESGSLSWKAASVSPPTPNSKLQDQANSFSSKLNSTLSGNGPLSLSKAFTPEAVVDLTARYCADFSLRTRPPVFPAPSLRAPPHSPPSPEPGETQNKFQGQSHHRYDDDLVRDGSGREGEREDRRSSRDSPVEGITPLTSSHLSSKLLWQMNGGADRDKGTNSGYNAMISSSSSLEVDGFRRQNSSPSSDTTWQGDKDGLEPRGPFMKVEPLDEDDEDEFEDEEDEEEMEEDEEQFKTENELETSETIVDDDDEGRMTSSSKSIHASYNDLVCQFCEKLFSDKVARKAHEALHSQKKLYSCCVCSASFHCSYSLRVHTMRNHKEGPYRCKYCFLDYGPPSEFRTHLIKEHSLPKKEYQSLKIFCFVTNSDSISPSPDSMLSSSNAVSEGEHDEDASTSSSNAFKHHRRSADNPEGHYNFSEDTSKALLSPNSIGGGSSSTALAHATNAKSENEEDMETCKICNKSFTKSYIRLHERAHADQKPYECPICNKRFGYKNNMKSHMKLHQGLKPYQCQICGARFTRGSTLRRHGRRHNISNSAMLDYVLYDQRASGRGGSTAAAAAAAAASLAHHKASMVPNSLLGAKSHYLLPNSLSNANSNANNNHNATSGTSSVPGSQVTPHHHHHHHHQQQHHQQTSTPQSSDTHSQSRSHHPHQHSAITTKHSAFGSMPSLIPAAGATPGNGGLDNERFSGGGSMKERSPNYHLSPTGNSPRVTSGHPNPFTSPNSIANPMVGGLAAVAAANLFGYPNAANTPQLYQFYASAAAVANPLMGYTPYPPGHSNQSVQSDALNLSLNKRKSPFEKDENNDENGDVKNGPSESKHSRLVDEAGRKITTSSQLSPNDDQNFVDSSSGISSASSDSKSVIKEETRIKEELDQASSNQIKSESESNTKDANFLTKSSSSPSLSPRKISSPDANSNTREDLDDENEKSDDVSSGHQLQQGNHSLHHRRPHKASSSDRDSHPFEYSHQNNNDHDLSLKVSTEDFGAQVNICCPSPQVQSSTGSTTSAHQSPSQRHASNSPVGSSSGPDSLLNDQAATSSPTGSGEASQASSPVNSNSAPSPTLNSNDSGQDILLSLLSAGKLFRCSFCDIYFTEYAMFRLHQKYHESDSERPFLCAVCREDCKDKTYFTVHLSEHLGLGPKNGLP